MVAVIFPHHSSHLAVWMDGLLGDYW